MLFLEHRGEFLVATIKHGLHITNPKITSNHYHQKTAISGTFFENPSKMVRETLEEKGCFSNNPQTNVEFISKKHPN